MHNEAQRHIGTPEQQRRSKERDMEDLANVRPGPDDWGRPGDGDLLHGLPAIGRALGVGARQAAHLKDTAGLPTFKLGKTVCARRSTLNAWLAEREAAAMAGRGGAGQP